MATYASTTNPFLESQLQTAKEIDRTSAKNAPGMAKPCRLIEELIDDESKLIAKEQSILLDSIPSLDQANDLSSIDSGTETITRDTNFGAAQENEVIGSIVEDFASPDLASEEAYEPRNVQSKSISSNILTKSSIDVLDRPSSVLREQNGPIEVDELEEDDNDGKDDDDGLYASTSSSNRKLASEKDSRQHQHIELIKKLRLQLRDLEKYAYERGELEQVPASVIAERQTVIIDRLKEKLSLNIDKETIEKLNLDQLKEQVDKEIHELIDPIVTKEYLLNQLKTQLTDLERYISHLHETIGKGASSSKDCHACHSRCNSEGFANNDAIDLVANDDPVPKISRLIRSLTSQLICSDVKPQKSIERNQLTRSSNSDDTSTQIQPDQINTAPISKPPQFHDGAIWTMHIDKVILATDSLTNLFQMGSKSQIDDKLIESVVRRQLVPAVRDLLSYGLIDPSTIPKPVSYSSFLFDPYYLFSTFTCFPSAQTHKNDEFDSITEKIYLWNVIEDYYNFKSEPNFKKSSVKTLSQSFNLTPSVEGPIKVTSKQALLIAVDDIIERLSRSKPNGPESHFKALIYVALNQRKLTTWIRLVFRNKSVIKKYYHNFSFVSQQDKMDKFLSTIDALSRIDFELCTDLEPNNQFVSAF